MSSRQVKWLREQLRKKHPQEVPEDDDSSDEAAPGFDFSVLRSDSSGPATPDESPPNFPIPASMPPPPKKRAPVVVDEETEYEELARRVVAREAQTPTAAFPMSSLNLVRELKSKMGATRFDECLQLPKSAVAIRFMGRLKNWPKTFTPYFDFVKDGPNFKVNFTKFGEQQSQILQALSRLNDAPGILSLGQTAHFSPPALPVYCQQLLFDREFDSATEISLKGLYVIQQSLPATYIPLQSKLVPSPGRLEYLELVAFVARFAFRRSCFDTSLALWKFGIGLTIDDPIGYILLAAVPALYAGDVAYVEAMLSSDITWRDIPVQYIPDWPLVHALMVATDDVSELAKVAARWPFIFESEGMTCDMDVPASLSSVGSAVRRRIAKYLERPEMDGLVEAALAFVDDVKDEDEMAIAWSYWAGVELDDIEFGAFVEEFVMPTG
jgi:hypothetical protein